MKQTIEAVCSIVITVAALVFVSLYVKSYFSPANSEVSIRPGEFLPNLPSYDWKSHDSTLVIAVRYGCHYCEASMPFYRRLAEMEKNGRVKAHLLAIFPDKAIIAQDVLTSQQLPAESVPGVSFDALKVSGTPTLILVDQTGKALRVWEGQLPVDKENEVIRAIESSTVGATLYDDASYLASPALS